MARTPLLNLRVDDDRKARWETAAKDAGETLADFIRDAVDARVEAGAPKRKPPRKLSKAETVKQLQAKADGIAPPKTGRTGMCVHRIKPDQFCSRCD